MGQYCLQDNYCRQLSVKIRFIGRIFVWKNPLDLWIDKE